MSSYLVQIGQSHLFYPQDSQGSPLDNEIVSDVSVTSCQCFATYDLAGWQQLAGKLPVMLTMAS